MKGIRARAPNASDAAEMTDAKNTTQRSREIGRSTSGFYSPRLVCFEAQGGLSLDR